MSRVPILVQKFGGTSVSSPDRRQQVAAQVRAAIAAGHQVAIVVSAMGRRGDPYATDTLLDLLRGDGGPVDPRDYDLIFTCGEAISVAVMAHTLKRAGVPAVGLTSAQARIFTDGHHVEADIETIDTTRLRALMAAGQVPVVTGGQGVARDSLDYTTLGRGGSDTSGVALGVALGARRVDIFTDVAGVAVVDPRLVPGARMLRRVSYGACTRGRCWRAGWGARPLRCGPRFPRTRGRSWPTSRTRRRSSASRCFRRWRRSSCRPAPWTTRHGRCGSAGTWS